METKSEFLQEAEMIMKEDYESIPEKSPPSESDHELGSGSQSGKEEEDGRVIKELKKIQKQNFITHCLVSAMIVLTVTWQLSEVSLILNLKDRLNNPFRSLGDFITGIFKRRHKPIFNFTEDENQRQGVDAESLPTKIPDLPHLDLPSLDFITEEK